MNYLRYTTALTGRDQAALLSITWPQQPILLDADFSRIEERILGWMADPASFIWDEASAIDPRIWDESHYIKSGRVRHLGVMTGRFNARG